MGHIHGEAAFMEENGVSRWVGRCGYGLMERITGLQTGISPQPGDERVRYIVPGLDNVHSHAF